MKTKGFDKSKHLYICGNQLFGMVKTLLKRVLFLGLFSFFVLFAKEASAFFASNSTHIDSVGLNDVTYFDTNPYAVSTNEKLVLKYYPNPAHDFITFEFSQKTENNCRLVIYSFTGRTMTEAQISNQKITVNLAGYFRGLYMFQLISPKNQVLESGKFQVLK